MCGGMKEGHGQAQPRNECGESSTELHHTTELKNQATFLNVRIDARGAIKMKSDNNDDDYDDDDVMIHSFAVFAAFALIAPFAYMFRPE